MYYLLFIVNLHGYSRGNNYQENQKQSPILLCGGIQIELMASQVLSKKYLGTIDNILQRATNGPSAGVNSVDIFEVAALPRCWGLSKNIGLIEIIDEVVPKRKTRTICW